LGAHVFVVNKWTFPVHRDRRFCGIINSEKPNIRDGIYADLLTLRKEDLAIFYKARIDETPEDRGFYGIYRIKSDPFFDDSLIQGVGAFASHAVIGEETQEKGLTPLPEGKKRPVLPNRILLEDDPVVYFERPIPDNIAYVDRADPEQLWTMLFRKVSGPGRARSITHLLPEEEKKVIRLLYKMNLTPTDPPAMKAYNGNTKNPIRLDLSLARNGAFDYETTLKAWLAQNIDKNISVLREVIGPPEDIEFFSPEVLYGIGGEKVDFLVLHRKKWKDGTTFRYKVTVIEAKKDGLDEDTVFQVQRYSRWMSQLVPGSDVSIVQPVLIGNTADADVVKTAEASRYGRQPIIIEYSADKKGVKLTRKL